MKKVVLAVCLTSLALAVSAHTRDEQKQHMGRRSDDGVTAQGNDDGASGRPNDGTTPGTATVPESTPTVALTLISLAGAGAFTAFLRSRKAGA